MDTNHPIALSPMHQQQVEMGAVMELIDGWQRAVRYTSAVDELERVKTGVGIFDESPVGKLITQGMDLDNLLGTVFPSKRRVSVGTALQISNHTTLARIADDELWLIAKKEHLSSLTFQLEPYNENCIHSVDITSLLAAISIIGPHSSLLLSSVTELDLSPFNFKSGRCAQTEIAGVHCTLVRLDTADLPAYSLYFGREYGDYMWESLFEVGRNISITPSGTEAMAIIRPES